MKIGIITLNGYFNYGNRLQNYALTRTLQNYTPEVYTIWDRSVKDRIKDIVKCFVPFKNKYVRNRKFYNFTQKHIKKIFLDNYNHDCDYVVVGSDQVWNYRYVAETPDLLYKPKNGERVLSYAASFGYDAIPSNLHEEYRETFEKYEIITVRESNAVEIVKNIIDIECVQVLDPTMLLSRVEWDEIAKKPKKLKIDKYIIKNFLGDISKDEDEAIKSYANENKLTIIDLSDENSSFYSSGPEEFLYLIKNATLICTDSFHCCVFSLIYEKPFIVFKRKGVSDHMYSRIENLLRMMCLEEREFKGVITKDDLICDYKKMLLLLEEYKNKSISVLDKIIK